MRRSSWKFRISAAALCLFAVFCLAAASEVDNQLTAKRRVFSHIGPGLRAVRHGPDGRFYVLASPGTGLVIFDAQGKQLFVIGAPPPAPVAEKAGRSSIAFGSDCDVNDKGEIFVADRGYNLVSVFSSDGTRLRSFPVTDPLSVAALPDREVATSSSRGSRLITVFNSEGHVAREFGAPDEDLSSRPDLNRYLSTGRVQSDPRGHLYYGFTYLPEPLIRQYDRFGLASQEFQFLGLDAYPESQAARREISRQEKRQDPPVFQPILTAFGVDPVSGEVWMCLHNTLLHFDKEGNRRSEYQIYTPDGARLEATVLLVEPDRLLIGSDPLGVYEFARPDRAF